ncbi:phosphoglycerate transport regulator PgtC [Escherichia coli]|nr:phosphoglycerate transport regulator PgtC [Escherichia coli]EHL6304209.1 phosphoglycerate transport regulator PgtC [Escherichia coli]NHR32871.1 phosphoglycerate transport regulator PgtC [Escherichia coli]HDW4069172.1 phosphoglycerate transport regulator PgtC [Escherichia coli]HEB5751186.1 phosphoglycerate transport regulator PgtC [Escherichia coli]
MNRITNLIFGRYETSIRTITLLLLLAGGGNVGAQRNELVMATTFSPGATAWIIQRWQTKPDSVMIRTLNRTSASLEHLLDTTNGENVDLILTSSPMLLQHLQEHHKLAPFNDAPTADQNLVPESIRGTSVAVAISGFGLLINRTALSVKHLPAPGDWDDLTLPIYQDALLMSSPSRSDTNHLMVESLLQQKGWVNGWKTLLTSAGNLVTISSRSFGVADKIKSGLGVAGPVIDNYANLLLNDPQLSFTYFPQSAVSPTYVAILRKSPHADDARRFLRYLLSPEGQRILADTNTGKYPVTPLAEDNPRATQQQILMNQPPLNYHLILKRQRLVQRLFDTAISFRLAQLKDAWRALHSAEARLKKPLPEIRTLLTQVPVSSISSEDPVWLAQFDNKSFAEQQMMEWQLWFLNNQRMAIKKLEELK